MRVAASFRVIFPQAPAERSTHLCRGLAVSESLIFGVQSVLYVKDFPHHQTKEECLLVQPPKNVIHTCSAHEIISLHSPQIQIA